MSNFLKQFEDIDLPLYGVRLPEILIDDSDYKKYEVNKKESNAEFLRALCRVGYKQKREEGIIVDTNSKDYVDRIKHELAIMDELGFTDYMLLVWDVINYCQKNKIPIGRGRGSAAGSLVLYLIGVTDIDPIKYGLFFERFISKARAKSKIVDNVQYLDGSLAPDIDLDICHDKRQDVIDYLEDKYKGKFCKLPTFLTLQSKILIKECGKIISGFDEDKMKEVSSAIPTLYGKVFELEKAYKESERFKEFADENEDVYYIARKLRKLIKNKSSHASAFLVSHDPLSTFMPCEYSTHGELTCTLDMTYAQEECIKLDLLGLQAVTLADKVCKAVGIKESDIDVEDYDSIYAHLQDLKTPYGLFQISGDCNVRVTNDIRPSNLLELSAVVALARPGALAYVEKYANYINEDVYEPVHEFFDSVLKMTGGIPIFQEQAMKMSNLIGFTLEEAETLRRIIGKKKTKEMPAWKDKVYEKISNKSLEKTIGDVLWKVLDDSADYSFNASHAFSYASLSATTIFLKFNYPQHFFIECMRMAQHKADPLTEMSMIQEELKEFGIQLLPPDLIKSDMDFSIEGGNIRFGLSAIKGIADKSIDNVKDFIDKKTTNKFHAFQAARQAKVGMGVICPLIQAGALNSIGNNRPLLVLEAQLWGLLTEKERKWCLEKGGDWNWQLLAMVKDINEWKDEKGKNVARKTRFNTIKKNYQKYKDIYLANKEHPRFASYVYERRLLGYSYSECLQDIFKSEISKDLVTVNEIKHEIEGVATQCVVEVKEVKRAVSAKGWKYMRIVGCDETGTYNFMMGGDTLEQYLKDHKRPKEDSFLFIKGRKGDDIVWIDRLADQDYRIFLKLHELRGAKIKDEKLVDKIEK